MQDLNFGFEWSFPFKIDWMDPCEELNGTSLHEKPLWKEQSVSQCSYSYDKTEMLLMTELPLAFICVKLRKFSLQYLNKIRGLIKCPIITN